AANGSVADRGRGGVYGGRNQAAEFPAGAGVCRCRGQRLPGISRSAFAGEIDRKPRTNNFSSREAGAVFGEGDRVDTTDWGAGADSGADGSDDGGRFPRGGYGGGRARRAASAVRGLFVVWGREDWAGVAQSGRNWKRDGTSGGREAGASGGV